MQLDDYDLHALRKLYSLRTKEHKQEHNTEHKQEHKQVLSASLSPATLQRFQEFVAGGMKTPAWGVQSSFAELAILLFLASQNCIPMQSVADNFQSILSRSDCGKVADNLRNLADFITDNV